SKNCARRRACIRGNGLKRPFEKPSPITDGAGDTFSASSSAGRPKERAMARLGDVLDERALPRPSAPSRDPDTPCPICQGAGWVRVEVPVGDPMFGKAVMCDCRK